MGAWLRWREATERALYGPGGFYLRPGAGPAGEFRTSAHASPLFAAALLRLIDSVLPGTDPLPVVDVGAGRGELLTALVAASLPDSRLRPIAVERAPRPDRLPDRIDWRDTPPEPFEGVLLATEWLDNVPVDVSEVDEAGEPRYVEVDPATGEERLGGSLEPADATWLDRWWPLRGAPPGTRAEIGRPRDEAWAAALRGLRRGLALAVDYGHTRATRPPYGSLTGYRAGRQTHPVPDGSGDITAHVAFDAVAERGGYPYRLISQREALRALGADGARPPIALAGSDPAGYLRALAAAAAAAELTEPAGLGAHLWLVQPIGIDHPLAAASPPVRPTMTG
ncbi:SAM-dependent methyltransferase [Rhizomonospora bruguierae]|uniref:SAM-dependent methyltransferase n=1 Tax=Rhizomonospora bruguierae TaxID=1581705 RepID=UPI001BCFFD26|nr:SAM-dependent methyltransferase [Micromonospora sp. NBRC 107566]